MLHMFAVLMSLADDFTSATIERRPLSHAFLFLPFLTVYYLQHHNIVASVCVCVCVNVSAGCSGAECSSYFNLPVFCHMICFPLVDLHFIADANCQMRLATRHRRVCTSSGACCIVFFEPRTGQNFHEPFTCPC